MSVTRRRFSQEFKDKLCREVISTSKPIKEVNDAHGVGPENFAQLAPQISLCSWRGCVPGSGVISRFSSVGSSM